MLTALFSGPLTAAVEAALAGVTGAVAVLDDPALARRLAERGREVVAVGKAGRRRRPTLRVVDGAADALPFADGELAALVAPGLATGDDWTARLDEWRRAVRDGGLVIALDRGEPSEATRRALCGGLTDLAQRGAGRVVVTVGRVVRLSGESPVAS